MKTLFRFVVSLFLFAGISSLRAEEILTPDGYLGHPAFEIGINGSPDIYTYSGSYTYTNYTNTGASTGSYNFNYNHVFLNIDFPVDRYFTLAGGGSFLINSSGSGTYQNTANTFTGTENGSTIYNYTPVLSRFFSMKFYTK